MTATQYFMTANRALDEYRRALDDLARGAGDNRQAAAAAAAAAEEAIAMMGQLWTLHAKLMDKTIGVKPLSLPAAEGEDVLTVGV